MLGVAVRVIVMPVMLHIAMMPALTGVHLLFRKTLRFLALLTNITMSCSTGMGKAVNMRNFHQHMLSFHWYPGSCIVASISFVIAASIRKPEQSCEFGSLTPKL